MNVVMEEVGMIFHDRASQWNFFDHFNFGETFQECDALIRILGTSATSSVRCRYSKSV